MTTQNARVQLAQRDDETLAVTNLKRRELRWAGDMRRIVGKLQDDTIAYEGGYSKRYLERWPTLAAAITAIGATNVELQCSKAMTLTANATLPITTAIKFIKGGSIALNGFTLTINGPFIAGRFQVFTGLGSVVFGGGVLKEAMPEWWGGKANGSTDNYDAIVAAYTAHPVVSFANGTYNYGTTLAMTGVGGANDGVTFVGAGLFSTILRYTGSSDGITMGGNLNGITLSDFRLTTLTGRDGISITAGVAGELPDAGTLLFRRVDIRTWERHAIKGRLTVDVRTDALQIVENGGCGIYVENANPFRSTTWLDTGSWIHANEGHGIVLKGTFSHTFSGTISDSNSGISTDADTLSSAGYTLIGDGTYTACVESDIGKSVTQGGVVVGTLCHYDNTDHHMIINCTTAPVGTGALAVVTPVGAGKVLYLDAAGYTNAVIGDLNKTVKHGTDSVGTLTAYDNDTRAWTITVTAEISGGWPLTISTGTGAGTAAGGSTLSAFRKNSHGLYAARSSYLNIQGGHYENHLYGIFLDSVYQSTIMPGYFLTQGTGAWGLYAAATCRNILTGGFGADVQSGGAGDVYFGILTKAMIMHNGHASSGYTFTNRSPDSYVLTSDSDATGLRMAFASTGSDAMSVSTTEALIAYFSSTDDVESILSVNNSGGVSGRATIAWRKDGTILARAFADNNLNAFVWKLSSNVMVINNSTLEDVVQTNDSNNFYLPLRSGAGYPIIEVSSGAAEGVHSLGRISGVAQANNGEKRVAEIDLSTLGSTTNERGGTIGFSTRTGGAAGVLTARATLDETGMVLSVPHLKSSITGITASTTQTQGQGALTKDINIVSTCANVNDTVTLPSAAAGMQVYIRNNGAQTLKIFPASADNINGTGVNTAVTLASGASVTYRTADTTNWYS